MIPPRELLVPIARIATAGGSAKAQPGWQKRENGSSAASRLSTGDNALKRGARAKEESGLPWRAYSGPVLDDQRDDQVAGRLPQTCERRPYPRLALESV